MAQQQTETLLSLSRNGMTNFGEKQRNIIQKKILNLFQTASRLSRRQQPNGHDRLRLAVRPGLHGDAQHPQVRQQGPEHQGVNVMKLFSSSLKHL
jgi:hypothetical protein